MKRIFTSLLVIGISLTYLSCDKSSKLESVLRSMNQESYYIPQKGWNIEQVINFGDSIYHYDLNQEQKDTLFSLSLKVYSNQYENSEETSYSIEWFQKDYTNDGYNYTLAFKEDTLFFFRSVENKKEFFIGKYYYMLMYPSDFYKLGYTPYQLIFIKDNIDSLKTIKGDSLIFDF